MHKAITDYDSHDLNKILPHAPSSLVKYGEIKNLSINMLDQKQICIKMYDYKFGVQNYIQDL